jgi:hypothetical protein
MLDLNLANPDFVKGHLQGFFHSAGAHVRRHPNRHHPPILPPTLLPRMQDPVSITVHLYREAEVSTRILER